MNRKELEKKLKKIKIKYPSAMHVIGELGFKLYTWWFNNYFKDDVDTEMTASQAIDELLDSASWQEILKDVFEEKEKTNE